MEPIQPEPSAASGGRDLAHAMATPTAKLRLYARTLADCLPALLEGRAGVGDGGCLPAGYRALLEVLPERLTGLAEEIDALARTRGLGRVAAAPGSREGGADRAPAGSVAPGVGGAGNGRPLVLVVEDDYDSRELTRVMLELDGWEVAVAADGDPALALLAERAFDLVLMDCRLTRLHGWETTARLRAAGINRRVPVIGLSASPEEADRARGLAAGMDAYLVKPLTDLHLADLRRRYLSRQPDHP